MGQADGHHDERVRAAQSRESESVSDAELRAVRAPALLLIGEHERLYDARVTLKRAQERMPGLTGAVIPNASHLAAMAQPDDVNERMIRFLRGIALPSRSEAA